jgi:hypothetical protein
VDSVLESLVAGYLGLALQETLNTETKIMDFLKLMARFIDKSMDYGSRGDLRDDLHCIRMID